MLKHPRTFRYNPGNNHLSNNNVLCFLMLSVAVHGVTKNILDRLDVLNI